jgi:hypothetical protein
MATDIRISTVICHLECRRLIFCSVANMYAVQLLELSKLRLRLPTCLQCASDIKKNSESVSHVAITTDGWSSNTAECYVTMTCHFMSKWQLHSVILQIQALSEWHSGENLTQSMISQWMSGI